MLLAHYDDPRKAGAFPTPRKNITWRERLQDRVFAENLLHKWEPDMGATSLVSVRELCLTMYVGSLFFSLRSVNASAILPIEKSDNGPHSSTVLSEAGVDRTP